MVNTLDPFSGDEPAYPAARAAALRVHPHYAQHLAARIEADRGASLLPEVETIEAMIDVAFWASLRREENHTPRVSLSFVAPAQVELPLVFERPVALAAQPLTQLAPAVERPGIHLCVGRRHGELVVWGATRTLPEFCFVLEVVAPGLLVIKHSRGEESGKFVNVAVLQGEEIKVVDQHAATAPDCPELLTSLLGTQSELDSPDSVNVLIQLAVSMRAHGRGGSLLVVPADTEVWQESILQPVRYAVAPPFCALVDLMSEDRDERSRRRWKEALHRVVEGIAGLTAVDGATVITDRYELLAFGVKILRRAHWEPVSGVIVTEPIEGTVAAIAEPAQLGGTRHLSAAQFAHDQRDAIALVASQDGRFTVLGWSPCEQMVHAHRIETLLL
jgi:hypothetical protein